jgi:hypothetical protein
MISITHARLPSGSSKRDPAQLARRRTKISESRGFIRPERIYRRRSASLSLGERLFEQAQGIKKAECLCRWKSFWKFIQPWLHRGITHDLFDACLIHCELRQMLFGCCMCRSHLSKLFLHPLKD